MRLNSKNNKALANAIRMLSVDAVQKANSGHPGMPMGMADVATVLYKKFLKFDSSDPYWPNRDRFVLSAGHGSMLLYSLLYLTGCKDINIGQIKKFRQLGSKTAGHPEYGELKGIETTTGPLGQGIANALGIALSEKMLSSRYGNKICDHKTFVLAGDGCLMEGISQEAISLAGHLKLGKLIILFDDNGISIDGPTSLTISDDHMMRFKASKWNTIKCNGHSHEEIESALKKAIKDPRPSIIAFKTKIGYGSPNKEGKSSSHGSPMGVEEIKLIRKEFNWPFDPFHIPGPILTEWKKIGIKGKKYRDKWHLNLKASKYYSDLKKIFFGETVLDLENSLKSFKRDLLKADQTIATRKASENVLVEMNKVINNLVGGSADLTGSNNTLVNGQEIIKADNYKGSYIYYGVREHAMAAIMNGIAIYGAFIPYGGTFLVFSDYCRPAIRLSALMGLRVIYVMTHDSIGLGEDGPTHQPIEHLSSLRAIPNLEVWRPCDSVETLECWQSAINSKKNPSVLALSRQNLQQARTKGLSKNLCSKGAYELISNHMPQISLFASGSEVEIALSVSKTLFDENIPNRVISVPCLDRFLKQDRKYIDTIVGKKPKVIIEAGVKQSWDCILQDSDYFIGMNSFGSSAPGGKLYEHFDITGQKVLKIVKSIIKKE